MTRTSTIAVGVAFDPGKGPTTLFCLPGETPPDYRPGLTSYAPRDLNDALILVRDHYASHESIASLGGAEIGGDHPWRFAIESRLCEFFEDLGNSVLDSWAGAANAINNLYRIARGSTSVALTNALAGRPAICLGAGPSATPAQLARIAALSKTHYVFACDCMVDACRAAGFEPHFVTMVERLPEMVHFVANVNPKASTLVCTPVVDNACVSRFDQVCFWWSGDDICTWLDPAVPPLNAGRSSGTLTLASALLAGCSPVYLVGHDLSYGPDQAGHAPSAHSIAVDYQKADDAKTRAGNYSLERFPIPGYSGPVTTHGIWSTMLGDLAHVVAVHPEQTVLSAQEGRGAIIPGVSPGCLPEVDHLAAEIPPFAPAIPSNIPDAGRIESLHDDLARLVSGAESAPLDPSALALSNFVSARNLRLFRYIFRSVTSSLLLRLHLRVDEGAAIQELCLKAQRRSYLAIGNALKEALCPPN